MSPLGGWAEAGWAALAGLLAGSLMLIFFLAGGMGAGGREANDGGGLLYRDASAWAGLCWLTAAFGALFAVALAVRHGRLRKTFANCFALISHHSKKGLAPHDELNLKHDGSIRMPFRTTDSGRLPGRVRHTGLGAKMIQQRRFDSRARRSSRDLRELYLPPQPQNG